MKLENIDTSTTAGKAEVMRLAAEGRKMAWRVKQAFTKEDTKWFEDIGDEWDWPHYDYAIISEPVGPEEVWVRVNEMGSIGLHVDRSAAEEAADRLGGTAVRYVRANDE